jgi:hemoglobin/transferrin/lactoferrin receptor protein
MGWCAAAVYSLSAASSGRSNRLRNSKLKLFPAAALFLLAGSAPAFEGRVLFLGSGGPVAGAEVTVLGSNVVQRTDAGGGFTWIPSPTPPFEILVVLPGGRYMKPVRVETIPDSGPVIIEVLPLAEESVTVTAGAAPTIESTPAGATTVVPRAEIESRQPANLAQLLEGVAGISTVSEGQAGVPAMRGLARGRTLILIDGARVASERRVGASATYLDPFVLDAVEVSRGPASVAYGSDAFGGVIAARTRGIEPGGALKVRAVGDLAVGTPGGRVGAEVSGGLGARGGFLVLGHWREYGDWDSPEGEVFNSGFRDSGVLLRAGYRIGPGLLTAGFQGDYGEDIDRPRNNSRTVRFFYPKEDSERFTLSYEMGPVGGFTRMGLTGFVGSYAQVTDQDRFATPSAPRSVERADVSADDFQARGFAERLFGPVRVAAGLDVNGRYGLRALDVSIVHRDPVVENVNVSIDDARRTDVGGYVAAEAGLLPRLSLAAGARGDRVTTRNFDGHFGDRSTSNGDFSGFVSLTAGSFGGFSATGQVARGFRDPVLSDRYFRGPSGRGFITGNPDLEPETSLQIDLALRYSSPGYRLALYAYQYRISDLIERFQTDPDFFFFRNRGKARLRGVELEAQADLGSGFSLGLAAQLERGVTLDDDLPLDDVPSPSISLQARRSFGRAFAQIRGAVYDRDDRAGPTEQARPGYGLVDIGGGFQVTEWLELQAYVRNLLDKKYLVSPDARAILSPGISGSLTAFVRL